MGFAAGERRPLGHRLVAGGVAAFIGVGLAFAVAPPARADSNVDEAQFFAFLNGVRAKNGVPPLATDGQLINVARGWSAQMAGAGALSHNPDLGSQVTNWRTLGENVGTGGDVTSVEAALEASPHHFQNMVDPAFQYVGIGVVEAGGAIWVTEDFKQAKTGTGVLPSTQVPQPAPTPRPSSAPSPSTASAPRSSSTPAHARRSSAVPTAAVAGAGGPSPGANTASAAPAPGATPEDGSGPATSHTKGAKALPAGLAVVSSSPVIDGPRFAALALFAVLAAAAMLAAQGRLPGVPRFSSASVRNGRR
jgi:hypothetical protein